MKWKRMTTDQPKETNKQTQTIWMQLTESEVARPGSLWEPVRNIGF